MFETIDNLSPSNQQTNTPQASPPSRLRPIQPNTPTRSPQSQLQNLINPSPPDNLPTGDRVPELPEDIFGANPADQIQEPQISPVRETESAIAGNAIPQFLPNHGNTPNSLPTPAPLSPKSSGTRKALVFFLSALVVALLFIGGYLAYKIFIAQKFSVEVQNVPFVNNESGQQPDTDRTASNDQPPQDEKTDTTADNTTADNTAATVPTPTEENIPPAEPEKEPSAEREPEPAPIEPPSDTDADGLNDLEELQLGSNPRVADTDLDGLDDYSEVKIYHTNPVKRDTDGDGYDDGTEVKNGYDPLGTGKL